MPVYFTISFLLFLLLVYFSDCELLEGNIQTIFGPFIVPLLRPVLTVTEG